MSDVGWWARWFACTFPVAFWRRYVRRCPHMTRYDGAGNCLSCYAPWFQESA